MKSLWFTLKYSVTELSSITHTHTIYIHIYTRYVCDVYMLKSSMINYTYHHYLYAAQLTKRQNRITLNS